MASRYQKIILLCCLVLASCSTEKASKVTLNKAVNDGDIIVRKEGGFISSLFSSVATQSNAFSHIGILLINDEGSVDVIHSELEDTKEASSLRKESIDVFMSEADTIGVFRLQLPDSTRMLVATVAQKLLDRGAAFDLDFDIETDSILYCTEFVAKAINMAVDSALVCPTKNIAGKIGYSIDDIIEKCDDLN